MAKPRSEEAEVSGVTRNVGNWRANRCEQHRRDADDGAQFRQMQRGQAGNLILRAQQQHGGECQQSAIAPVARLGVRGGRKGRFGRDRRRGALRPGTVPGP